MINIDETKSGLRIIDAGNNELKINIQSWEHDTDYWNIDRYIDNSISIITNKLEFPEGIIHVENLDNRCWDTYVKESKSIELDRSDYLINVESYISTYVKFSGSAKIQSYPNESQVIITFPKNVSLTLGFRSMARTSRNEITIPKPYEGVEVALKYLSSNIETLSPDKSYPSMRRYPPSIKFGDKVKIPELVKKNNNESDTLLCIPDSLEYSYILSPVAYYLQTDVNIENRHSPQLKTEKGEVIRDFKKLPDLENEVYHFIYKIFYLDCLVRNGGPYNTNLKENKLLNQIGLDPEATYQSNLSHRLIKYLEVEIDKILSDLPDWHLTTYVNPDIRNFSVLPHLLDRFSLIFLPKKSEIDRFDFLDQSITDGRRSLTEGNSITKLVSPDLNSSLHHGWVDDDIAINCFNFLPSSIRNRDKYFREESDQISIVVVLNDIDMFDEYSIVSNTYYDRSKDLPIHLEYKTRLKCSELIEVLSDKNDLVHYIGHCSDNGFRCRDGYISTSEIEESQTQTFFFNACGSINEGKTLINRGSVAGVVTINDVIGNQASTVGNVFSKLLVNGFCIDRALEIARRETLMSNNYVVIGDGSHTLVQGDDKYQTKINVVEKGGDEFEVTFTTYSVRDPGGFHQPYIPSIDKKYLFGNEITKTIQRPTLVNYLSDANIPVIYNDEFFWSGELLKLL